MNSTTISLSRNSQFWIFQLIGWGVWVFLQVFRDLLLLAPGYIFPQTLVYSLIALAGIFVTAAQRYFYNLVWEKNLVTRFFVVWLGTSIASLLWQPFRNLALLIPIENGIDFGSISADSLFDDTLSVGFPLMIVWSSLYFIIKYYQLFQLEKEKNLRSEALAHEAQLLMLRYQLNPHFLFNTLNAISTLVLDHSTQRANEMVTKLSKFLRYTLDHSPLDRVGLAHEVQTLRLYLDIEKVRFAERLRITFEIAENVEKALVPSMLLQPLVENSIKHAISKSIEGGSIIVSAQRQDSKLILSVADDGPGSSEFDNDDDDKVNKTSGVGIGNIRNRLNEFYGDKHSFTFSNMQPTGCKAVIVIPFENPDGD